MTGRPNPDILVVARESRNASQAAVAEAVNISQGMISKAENGLVTLATDQVAAIASFLDYPAALCYEPGRARTVGSACLYHRSARLCRPEC